MRFFKLNQKSVILAGKKLVDKLNRKLCKSRILTGSDCLHNQRVIIMKFYNSIKTTKVSTSWFIKLTENERLLFSTTFTAKCEYVFVLTKKNTLSYMFHFKAIRKSINSKTWFLVFLKLPSVWDIGMFLYEKSKEILNVFIILTLKRISFFKSFEYCFSIETTKIEKATFPLTSVRGQC